MKQCIAALLTGLFLVAQPATSGEKKDDPFAGLPKPGPEHKFLASMEGATVSGRLAAGAVERALVVGRASAKPRVVPATAAGLCAVTSVPQAPGIMRLPPNSQA